MPRIVPSKKDAPFLGMEELVGTQASADFMEELSVLYVGMTRARSFLDIVLREGTKAPLAILLRRALQVDADRVVEEFDGLTMRESDETRGRGGLAMDRTDPGIAASTAGTAMTAIAPFTGRPGHATPSGNDDGGTLNVPGILTPANRVAMQRGELVHAWLRQVSWLEDGLPEHTALVKSTADLATGLARTDVADWARNVISEMKLPGTGLHHALTKPDAADSGTIELWRERAFAVLREANGRLQLLNGTFDRVMLWRDRDGKALRAQILDFKTDRFSSAEELAAMESRYAPQLAAYREAICLLCPGLDAQAVTASLVFVTA
jgi:ATP-dependent exoDNAse (exonuclease V) beta subunit